MRKIETKEEIGSRTAKTGFKNEDRILSLFQNWDKNESSQYFLKFICKNENISYESIKRIGAEKIGGRGGKADITIEIITATTIKKIGISLKKQEEKGYNHIDRREPGFFADKFNFSETARLALYKYCGIAGYSPVELYEKGKISQKEYETYKDTPHKGKTHSEGRGRFFLYELNNEEQNVLLNEFKNKQEMILAYILKGEGSLKADYLIITKHTADDEYLFHIETIEETIIRARGNVLASKRGSIHFGKMTAQRKGGTGGAWQIQFKWSNIFPETSSQ